MGYSDNPSTGDRRDIGTSFCCRIPPSSFVAGVEAGVVVPFVLWDVVGHGEEHFGEVQKYAYDVDYYYHEQQAARPEHTVHPRQST